MKNTVNKQNSIGLKEVGFDQPSIFYYTPEIENRQIQPDLIPRLWNKAVGYFSAPDFLEVGDWLRLKHDIQLIFTDDRTELIDFSAPIQNPEIDFLNWPRSIYAGESWDHRNHAVSEAIQIIKQRIK